MIEHRTITVEVVDVMPEGSTVQMVMDKIDTALSVTNVGEPIRFECFSHIKKVVIDYMKA